MGFIKNPNQVGVKGNPYDKPAGSGIPNAIVIPTPWAKGISVHSQSSVQVIIKCRSDAIMGNGYDELPKRIKPIGGSRNQTKYPQPETPGDRAVKSNRTSRGNTTTQPQKVAWVKTPAPF